MEEHLYFRIVKNCQQYLDTWAQQMDVFCIGKENNFIYGWADDGIGFEQGKKNWNDWVMGWKIFKNINQKT